VGVVACTQSPDLSQEPDVLFLGVAGDDFYGYFFPVQDTQVDFTKTT
jgi:hypothetical protein